MSESVAPARRALRGVLLAGLVLLVGGVGCTSPTSPTVPAPFTQTDLKVGTGADAASGMTLLVGYTGWLYDDTKPDKKGEIFDASTPDRPFVFRLGAGQVIPGWDLGVPGMKVGGLRKLIVPSELAYGREGAGSAIPPNATLVFEIELFSVVGG